MQLTSIATVTGAVLAGAGLAASAALVLIPRADPGAQVWFDYPVAARTVFTGDLTVTSHTDVDGVTAISLRFSRDGQQTAVLTDTELERSGQGAGPPLLHWASVSWNPPVGEYQVEASVYQGSVVVATRTSTLSVVGPLAQPRPPGGTPTSTARPTPSEPGPAPDDGPTTPQVSPTPSGPATPTATPSPTPTKTARTPTPTPTRTSPKPTPTPTPTRTTVEPTPTPTRTTPTPTPTSEPPPAPLGGKVGRRQLDDYGWENTFTVTGLRPGDAEVWVEVNLHNTEKAPYYNGWQSYPCGSMALESGSGSAATYACTATFTIEPPAAWRGGSGEFRYWFPMPASVYRSKVVTATQTVYGTGGSWEVARKPA